MIGFSIFCQKKTSRTLWSYCALTRDGKRYKGQKQATSSSDLAKSLLDEGCQLISCHRLFWPGKIVSTRWSEFIDFTRHMGAFLKADFSLEESLESYSGSSSFQFLKGELLKDIRHGKTFSAAFKEVISHEDSMVTTLVSVAEKKGDLGQGFERLSSYLKDRKEFQTKLIHSLAYPCLLMLLVFFLITFLLVDVVPQLEFFLHSTGRMSSHSMALMTVSKCLNHVAYPFFLLLTGGGVALFIASYLSSGVTHFCQRLSLKIPFLGDFLLCRERHLFFENLSLLLESGVPLLEALKTGKVGNLLFFQSAIDKVAQDILAGNGLSQAFQKQDVIDDRSLRFLKAGESTGNLVPLLQDLNALSRNEIHQKKDRFTGSLEPASLLFVGGVLIWIVVSFFLPLYDSLEGFSF